MTVTPPSKKRHPRGGNRGTIVVAFANNKGGVGKSAEALGIADAALRAGLRVLFIDADPQMNATRRLGVGPEVEPTLADILTVADRHGSLRGDATLTAATHPAGESWGSGIRVVPASIDLADRELDTGMRSPQRLRRLIGEQREHVGQYDLVLIDTPPALGQLTINALRAADHLVIVTEADVDGISGMNLVLDALEILVEDTGGPHLTGIVVNAYDGDRAEARIRLDELRTAYTDLILDPVVPDRAAVSDSRGRACPVSALGARAYDLPAIYDTHLRAIMKEHIR